MAWAIFMPKMPVSESIRTGEEETVMLTLKHLEKDERLQKQPQ